MITERPVPVGTHAWLGAAGLAGALWLGSIAASALVLEAPGAIVFAPDAVGVAARLPDARLDAARRFSVAVRSEESGFARRLYRAGAWLVWPSWARSGCRLGTVRQP